MNTMDASLRTLARVFRRESHRVLDSERTTIQGADGMLMVLQLAMAEVNKKVILHCQELDFTHHIPTRLF